MSTSGVGTEHRKPEGGDNYSPILPMHQIRMCIIDHRHTGDKMIPTRKPCQARMSTEGTVGLSVRN